MEKRNGAISLWDSTAPPAIEAPPLAGEIAADVAIVGGGFTGLSAALHIARDGGDAVVLEAEDFGFGGSGRNAGLVNAGLWLPPGQVRDTLGADRGDRLMAVLGDAPSVVFDLIETYQIQCEAHRGGTIHAAHAPSGMPDLAARARQWQDTGAPVELLDRDAVTRLTGTRAFYGGLLDPRAGTINPMGYARGLARAAASAGARLHAASPVRQLTPDGDGWRLTTDQGSARARLVILATNAYTGALWPGLDRAFSTLRYFQVASRPLGARAADILPRRHGLWTTGTVMTSARMDAQGRLILGSMGDVLGPGAALSRRWANKAARRIFPDLGPIEWETAWSGRIAMTGNHLPRIFRLAPGLYTPIGYNGRGIGPGTVFGKAFAALAGGAPEADLPLPVTPPTVETAAGLRAGVTELALKAYRALASL